MRRPNLVRRWLCRILHTRRCKLDFRSASILIVFALCFLYLVNFMWVKDSSTNVVKYTNLGYYSKVLDTNLEMTSYGIRPGTDGVVTTEPPDIQPPTEYLDGETFCESRKRLGGLGDSLSSIREPQAKQDKGRSSVIKHAEDKSTCIIPKLDPCDPQIMVHDTNPSKFKCPEDENWVYVKNGTFRISQAAIEKHGDIRCVYSPIYRNTDRSTKLGPAIEPMLDGTPITSDAFQASCVGRNGTRYINIHLGVPNIPDLQERARKIPLSPTALGGYDFLILGFDSTSRMSWMRNMPRTREYFLKGLGAVELEGHNILGDGTTNNILPFLTGHMEQDLPSSRRGDKDAVFVDTFPFMFKDLHKAGYVTMWSEDCSNMATFQFRLKGFRDQPVDHYLRPYYMRAETMYNKFPQGCIGSESRHVRYLNYFRDAYQMYGKKRKFMFGFHKEFSHRKNNLLKWVDEDLLKFLKEIKHTGYLDHTILILMADHGARFSGLRSLQQGKLEERLPYFGISLPPSFKSAYPDKVNNLINNRQHLTTMFDVHETIREVLNSSDKRPSYTKGRGISLFQPIPTTRHCADCGVEPHWCACLSWENVAEGAAIRNTVVESIMRHFNGLTEPHRGQCELLKLKNIANIARYKPQKELLKFKGSLDRNGFKPDMSDEMDMTYEHLQVTMTTTPGDGQFEVTVTHHFKTGEIKIRSEEISRINVYGDAPACISESFPHLRPYCYCKSQS